MSSETKNIPKEAGLFRSINFNRFAFFAVVIVLSLLPVFVMLNLHRGLDVTDTAFFHLSIVEREQINALVTQFGVVWGLLPFEENILWLRWINFIVLSTSGAFAFISVFKIFEVEKKPDISFVIFLGLIGAGSACLYYILWLPGPSYNSLSLGLNLGLIGSAATLVQHLRNKRMIFVPAIVSGALIMALALTRTPSALFSGVSLCVLVLILVPHDFRTIFKIMAASAFGGIIFIIVTSILVEPIWITIDRLRAGATLTSDIGFIPPLGSRSKIFVEHVISNWREDWLFIFLASLLGVSTLNLQNAYFGKLLKNCAIVFGLFGLGGIIWPILVQIVSDINIKTIDVSQIAVRLLGASFLVSLMRILTSHGSNERRNAGIVCLLIIVLMAISVGQVFGSGNSWFKFLGAFPVFSILALALALCAGRTQSGFNYRFGILCLLVFPVQFAVWQSASETPYRLSGGLNEQVIRTEIRGGKSVLWLDTTTHDFLNELDALRPEITRLEERPILINLTGATPLVAYHLDLGVMGTPWILGGYKWSDDFLKHHIDQIDPIRLCMAWIVIAENSPRALSSKILSEKGIDLENGYTKHSISNAPHLNMPIEIFVPAMSNNACLEASPIKAAIE